MGDRPSHIRKAQHNMSLLNKHLPKKGFNDWKITAIFYACVHYVDSALAKLKIHPISHTGFDGRNTYVAANLRPISGKYQTLYNRSRYARYVPDSEKKITQQDVDKLINKYLPLFQKL